MESVRSFAVKNARGEVLAGGNELVFKPRSTWVAMFDYLGFKEVVAKLSEKDMVYNFHTVVDTFLDLHSKPTIMRDRENAKPNIKAVRFADTVILEAGSDSDDAFEALVKACAFFTGTNIALGLPVRGGIGVGPIVDAPGVYMGRGVLMAHQAEAAQSWAGCSLHAEAKVPAARVSTLIEEGFLLEYDVPTEKGSTRALTIGWPRSVAGSAEKIASRLRHLGKPATERDQRKHDNTVAFYGYYKETFGGEQFQDDDIRIGFASGNWLDMKDDELSFVIWA